MWEAAEARDHAAVAVRVIEHLVEARMFGRQHAEQFDGARRAEVKEVGEQTVKVDVQVYGRITPVDVALRQIDLVSEISN